MTNKIYKEYFEINNWQYAKKETLVNKSFKFRSFPTAISWMVEISFFAEQIDHHPEWKNIFDTVNVELTTHDKQCLTEKDSKMAKYMDNTYLKYK